MQRHQCLKISRTSRYKKVNCSFVNKTQLSISQSFKKTNHQYYIFSESHYSTNTRINFFQDLSFSIRLLKIRKKNISERKIRSKSINQNDWSSVFNQEQEQRTSKIEKLTKEEKIKRFIEDRERNHRKYIKTVYFRNVMNILYIAKHHFKKLIFEELEKQNIIETRVLFKIHEFTKRELTWKVEKEYLNLNNKKRFIDQSREYFLTWLNRFQYDSSETKKDDDFVSKKITSMFFQISKKWIHTLLNSRSRETIFKKSSQLISKKSLSFIQMNSEDEFDFDSFTSRTRTRDVMSRRNYVKSTVKIINESRFKKYSLINSSKLRSFEYQRLFNESVKYINDFHRKTQDTRFWEKTIINALFQLKSMIIEHERLIKELKNIQNLAHTLNLLN